MISRNRSDYWCIKVERAVLRLVGEFREVVFRPEICIPLSDVISTWYSREETNLVKVIVVNRIFKNKKIMIYFLGLF